MSENMFSMNIRSVSLPMIHTDKHACAGTVWTLDFDQRGVGRAAFCESRAHGRSAAQTSLTSTIQRTLNNQLNDWRQRKFPRWVWVNPRADAYVEGARDLGAITGAVVSALATRRIGALIHTRGGMPAGERLVLVGRRFPGLLRVDLEFFSHRSEIRRSWERGTSSIESRLELLSLLMKSGVEVGVRLGPIAPAVNDGLSDWKPLLARLAQIGVSQVVPTWLSPSRRLMTQIRREVSNESAYRIEALISSSDDTLYGQWQLSTMNMIRRQAMPYGLDVKRCQCGPDHSGSEPCLVGPKDGREERQLALFG